MVFDIVSRLVDKNLVQAEEPAHGEPHHRLLESLRAYAIERAGAAGELEALRDAHVAFWLDWLDRHEPVLHTDEAIAHLELFHDSVAAALDWSTRDPDLGLRFLRRVSRVWHGCGRPQAALTAVDQLLTDENAERFGLRWANAAAAASILVGTARSWPEARSLLRRGMAIADAAGDEYVAALNDMLLGYTTDNCTRMRQLAREAGQRYVECIATLGAATVALEEDPNVATDVVAGAEVRMVARESRYLRDLADRTGARAALYLGDLDRCLEVSRGLCASPSLLIADGATRTLGVAALLGRDDAAFDAAAVAQERLARLPGTRESAAFLAHQRALLAGGPPRVDPLITPAHLSATEPLPNFLLLHLCREAIDAGEPTTAVDAVRFHAFETPLGHTVRAAIEATAADDDRWHDAASGAGAQGLRLVAVDALEGLAAGASASEAWVECLRLAAAADRLRAETGYRWRFTFEQVRLDAAVAAATAALEPAQAESATAEGSALTWGEALAYAGRARGERRRPSHGWAALTPTELRVVALAAEGLTNPQIAEQLLMGRATVKTHLDHVFTKTGLHSRTELAAAYVRRDPDRSG